MESRLVSPPGGAVGVELYELRLAARSRHEAQAHRSGTREIVTVLSRIPGSVAIGTWRPSKTRCS